MATKEELEKELADLLKDVKYRLDEYDRDPGSFEKVWNEMVDKAHELHKLVNPKHHKYMIENRGVNPNDREFYNHIHPIEDLLSYIKDPNINDDPEDQTMNAQFIMSIYTRRWGHDDSYQVKRIENGWYINNISIGGDCDKTGHPYLYRNFNQDYVNYPKAIPRYMEILWDKCADEGLTKENVQIALDELAKWISACEKNSPSGIWGGWI